MIINPAAYTKVDLAEKEKDRAYAVNAAGAENLARAAEDIGCPIVHVSTDFVFDGRSPVPCVEEAETNPLSVYGASKLAGEKLVANATDAHVIVRTSWLYGTTGHNFVKTVLRLASEREVLRIVYDQTGTPTWSADLATAIAGICKSIEAGKKPWGIYHYSNEGVASWYDFAVAICDDAASIGMRTDAAREGKIAFEGQLLYSQIYDQLMLEGIWSPVYGKISVLQRHIVHFDLFLAAGLGLVWTATSYAPRENAGLGPAPDVFLVGGSKLAADLGGGVRFYPKEWMAFELGLAATLYTDRAAEGVPSVVQKVFVANFGVSMFWPFTFDYVYP